MLEALRKSELQEFALSFGQKACEYSEDMIALVFNSLPKSLKKLSLNRVPELPEELSPTSGMLGLTTLSLGSDVVSDDFRHLPEYVCNSMPSLTSLSLGRSAVGEDGVSSRLRL